IRSGIRSPPQNSSPLKTIVGTPNIPRFSKYRAAIRARPLRISPDRRALHSRRRHKGSCSRYRHAPAAFPSRTSVALQGSRFRLPAALIIGPQSDAAMYRVADRLRAQGPVDEEVGDPALGDADSEPTA